MIIKTLTVLRRPDSNRPIVMQWPCALAGVLALAYLLSACAAKMSLQEAQQVAVTMSHTDYSPPPRSIDDITAVFDQIPDNPEKIQQLMHKASAEPPAGTPPSNLLEFYYQRGLAAQTLGYAERGLADFRKALNYFDQSTADPMIKKSAFQELAFMEFLFSNSRNGMEKLDQYRRAFPESFAGDLCRALLYFEMGEIQKANQAKRQALNRMSGRRPSIWQSLRVNWLKALALEAEGKYTAAESHYRKSLGCALNSAITSEHAFLEVVVRKYLAKNLMTQGRLSEAEVEARRMLLDTIRLYGKQSYRTLARALVLSDILVAQERFRDAEKLLKTLMLTLETMQVNRTSLIMCLVEQALGEMLLAQARWPEALVHLQAARQHIDTNTFISNRYLADNVALPLALLKTGQTEKALSLLVDAHEAAGRELGGNHLRYREIQGLLAVAYTQLGRLTESFEYFSRAVPFLLQSRIKNPQPLRLILEGYLQLLDSDTGRALARRAGFDAIEESFRIAQVVHLKSVQGAIAKSAARLAIKDKQLAEITRQEQDTDIQIESLEALLAKHLSAPVPQQEPSIIADLRQRISTLRNARQVLQTKVKNHFPQYAAMLNPQPATVDEVRQHLHPGEVLISIYSAESRTYVWSVPCKSAVGFASAALGHSDIRQKVAVLRKALAPSPQVLGDIPEFDLAEAHALYATLLKPVENTFKGANDLLIVAPGSLGPLPFAVLPTQAAKLDNTSAMMFAGYRQVPWLTRMHSITRLPGVVSLITLRNMPKTDIDRRMFAGFGDPVFNRAQLQASREKRDQSEALTTRGGVRVHVRGIRNTRQGNLDRKDIVSGQLGQLQRLPDTADEIKGIATELQADVETDIFLGIDAAESRIKTMDLSNRRVIVFASHALLPGDLDGLNQPALALSDPTLIGGGDDGILTMEEILRLKLNADWVVLSACNTGASDGAGAEAVSGLGRAFLYAGTRAILVSMWPVETTSARKLTTAVFRNQKQDPNLPRSRALQKAMLDLIDNDGFKDPSSGRLIACYAHPLFWAPFIIVGEGAGTLN